MPQFLGHKEYDLFFQAVFWMTYLSFCHTPVMDA